MKLAYKFSLFNQPVNSVSWNEHQKQLFPYKNVVGLIELYLVQFFHFLIDLFSFNFKLVIFRKKTDKTFLRTINEYPKFSRTQSEMTFLPLVDFDDVAVAMDLHYLNQAIHYKSFSENSIRFLRNPSKQM